jgi:glucokinase
MVNVSHGYLAVDVGGTKLAAGVVDLAGNLVVRDRVPTPQRNVWLALERLILRVRAAAGVVELVGCGVGCGGPMSDHHGLVSPLHIPEWRDFPLRERLATFTGLATFVDNDAKALALGEGWRGRAVGLDDYLTMVVSTGVGGGIVSGGRLLEGRLGNAGHIGHVVVVPDGRACQCGGRGCLETYASGRAIAAETGRPPEASVPAAVVERTGTLVGRAVATVMVAVDLRHAFIGGSVAIGFGAPFFRAANEELDRRLGLTFVRGARVDPVQLGAVGPLVGAAAVARRALQHPGSTMPV